HGAGGRRLHRDRLLAPLQATKLTLRLREERLVHRVALRELLELGDPRTRVLAPGVRELARDLEYLLALVDLAPSPQERADDFPAHRRGDDIERRMYKRGDSGRERAAVRRGGRFRHE